MKMILVKKKTDEKYWRPMERCKKGWLLRNYYFRKHYKNYVDKVKNDNLTGSKRRKITTERYDNLKDICKEFDNLSGPQRHERLVEFLGLFARRDAIPDNQFEFAPDSDTEVSNSENESE